MRIVPLQSKRQIFPVVEWQTRELQYSCLRACRFKSGSGFTPLVKADDRLGFRFRETHSFDKLTHVCILSVLQRSLLRGIIWS
jgi:hypothetical protein